jgi:hypothetical protein
MILEIDMNVFYFSVDKHIKVCFMILYEASIKLYIISDYILKCFKIKKWGILQVYTTYYRSVFI